MDLGFNGMRTMSCVVTGRKEGIDAGGFKNRQSDKKTKKVSVADLPLSFLVKFKGKSSTNQK